jgi:tetratricopeptide (TPR) repeat protein
MRKLRRKSSHKNFRVFSTGIPSYFLNECLTSCSNCSAACLLRLKRYDAALEVLNESLDIAPDNAKALYRRGQAFHGKREYERSLSDLQKAQNLAPNDKSIASELAAVKGEIQAYKAKERMAYAKMFS